MTLGSKQQKTKTKSVLLTIIIFTFVAFLNAEILTGSTKIENFITVFTPLGMLFYGLQIAIVADIAARYKLGWRTIYVMGLIYGILEEGFAVLTMESPNSVGNSFLLRAFGLNVTWTIYIMIFHAVISVIATILIIRTVWPERVNKPFLKRKHYLVIVPIIVLIYVIAISLAASTYVPQPSAIIILILLCVGLLYLAKTGEKVIPKKLRGISAKSYIKYGILLIVLSVLIPLSIAKISPFEIPLTILFVILCYAFWIFFKRMDSDNNLTNKKLFYIFSLFILFWLFLGIIFRTPISTAAAFIGVGIEIYLGWSSLKNDDYTPKHN